MANPTLNYNFLKPDDLAQMSDVTSYLNNNWGKAADVPQTGVVNPLPDESSGIPVGSKFYSAVTGVGSIYICVANDPAWGIMWRPIHTKYGPWKRPGAIGSPNSCLTDALYNITDLDAPFQFRLTNDGRMQFRGAINKISGNWPDVATSGYYPAILAPMPIKCMPKKTSIMNPSLYPITSAATYFGAQCILDASDVSRIPFIRVWTNGASGNRVFFSGCQMSIGIQ